MFVLTGPPFPSVSPFQDYEGEYWYFEVVQFCVTLLLCGLTTFLPGSATTQVFISFLISGAMFGLLSNMHPYLEQSDDYLAQGCQVSLSLTLVRV